MQRGSGYEYLGLDRCRVKADGGSVVGRAPSEEAEAGGVRRRGALEEYTRGVKAGEQDEGKRLLQ